MQQKNAQYYVRSVRGINDTTQIEEQFELFYSVLLQKHIKMVTDSKCGAKDLSNAHLNTKIDLISIEGPGDSN